MSSVPFDNLLRKEVALGAIRELPWPQEYIGLSLAPFMDVASDDVVFEYIKNFQQDTMAPARAEDAESELAQKDITVAGEGRASIIDWALKDRYTPSDVTKYNEARLLVQALSGRQSQLNFLDPGKMVAEFQQKQARDLVRRKRTLDNRVEWMILTSLFTGALAYDDGKIKFSVDWRRPAAQTAQAPVAYNGGPTALWDAGDTHDPIGNLLAVSDFMWDTYRVRPTRAITSLKVFNTVWRSNRFAALAGVVGGTPSSPIDVMYMMPGWDRSKAVAAVEAATGIKFELYDSVYRTRPIGSSTVTNVRFSDDRDILLLPDPGTLGVIDDTEIGFAKTLTAPHPEGNWSSGYYQWEDEQKDPWQRVVGSGLKAFPVFPYMEYTYTMRVRS